MSPTHSSLIYTVAVDQPGQWVYRNLAKLLVSSVVRSGFQGKVVAFHNGTDPLFHFPRLNVYEVGIDLDLNGNDRPVCKEEIWSLKHRVSPMLNEYEWDKALFLDSDCIVTGPLNAIFEATQDVVVNREPGQSITRDQFNCYLSDLEMESSSIDGINSGVFCINRAISEQFFYRWAEAEDSIPHRELCCRDQAALNRVILDCEFTVGDCSHAVSMPFHTDRSMRQKYRASVVHLVGAAGEEKLKAAFGIFMETYFYDPSLAFFNLIET